MHASCVSVTCEIASAFQILPGVGFSNSSHNSASDPYHAAVQFLPHLPKLSLDLLSCREALDLKVMVSVMLDLMLFDLVSMAESY